MQRTSENYVLHRFNGKSDLNLLNVANIHGQVVFHGIRVYYTKHNFDDVIEFVSTTVNNSVFCRLLHRYARCVHTTSCLPMLTEVRGVSTSGAHTLLHLSQSNHQQNKNVNDSFMKAYSDLHLVMPLDFVISSFLEMFIFFLFLFLTGVIRKCETVSRSSVGTP